MEDEVTATYTIVVKSCGVVSHSAQEHLLPSVNVSGTTSSDSGGSVVR